MSQDEPVTSGARQAIDAGLATGDGVSVSPITAWELGLLSRRGRLSGAASAYVLFDRFAELPGISLRPLTPGVLIDSSFLPGDFHNDPADRIIVATARAFNLTIVTRDEAILDYSRQGYVRALKC